MIIRIMHDMEPMSPRGEEDGLTILATKDSLRHCIGDESFTDEQVYLLDKIEEHNPEYVRGLEAMDEELEDAPFERAVEWEDDHRPESIANEFERLFYNVPVYMYEHSGITLNTGRERIYPTNGAQIGFIFMPKEKVREEFSHLTFPHTTHVLERDGVVERTFNTLDEFAESILVSEVNEMDLYVTGQVYGFEIEEDGEVTDSCWGFSCSDFGRGWKTNGMAEHWPPGWANATIYVGDELEQEGTEVDHA